MTLAAIYYPYSRALAPSTLRKAALLFDTLHFLDSEPWFVRNAITRDKLANYSQAAKGHQIEEDYELLKSEGFIEVIDATSITRNHDELLASNVIHDIGDDEFCRTAIGYSVDTWAILRDRIPPSLLEALYPGAGTFSEAISLQAIINTSGDLACIGDEHVRNFAESRWRFDDPAPEALEVFLARRGYRYVIGGNPHIELPAYEFPFMQASSLRINECLVAAALSGLTPYTDSVVHDSLLRLKVNRALAKVDSQPELRGRLSIDLPLRFPRQSIALEVLDRIISDEALNRVPLSEILSYRSRNYKLLERFHAYMEVLSAEIEEVTPGDDYVKKVRRIVSSKVIPELTRARDDLAASYEDAFSGIVASSAAAVGPTIGATIFSGLDLWQVLLAGAIAEGGVLIAKAPDELAKAWKGKKANKRSPLAYVINIRPDADGQTS